MANTQSKIIEEVEVVSDEEDEDICYDCEGHITGSVWTKDSLCAGRKVMICRECYEQHCDDEGIDAEEDEEDE